MTGLTCLFTLLSIHASAADVYLAFPTCEDNEALCKTDAERAASREKKARREEVDAAARALQAKKEAEVTVLVKKLGFHRRAEAQKLVEMRWAAEAVTPKAQRLVAEQLQRQTPQVSAQSGSRPSATLSGSDGLSKCPMMPRQHSGTSGIHESREEAEAQAKSNVRCGAGGVASMETPSCKSHMKTAVTMSSGKTIATESPRWTCGVVATCVVGRPVCPDGPKGSSAQ